MSGRNKCEFLKELRKKIAPKNDIDYQPMPCDNQDDCPGYCFLCDFEAKFLLRQIREKETIGLPIFWDADMGDVRNYNKDISDITEEDYHEKEVSFACIPPTTMGIGPNPEMLPAIEAERLARKEFSEETGIEDWDAITDVMNMCEGCQWYDSIHQAEQGVRCGKLPESYFKRRLSAGVCPLKRKEI